MFIPAAAPAAASSVLLLWFQTPGAQLGGVCCFSGGQGSGSSHLVGQRVDSLLQVVVLGVQQRRLFALEGAVGVGVLPELADHGKLRNEAPNQDASGAASQTSPSACFLSVFVLFPLQSATFPDDSSSSFLSGPDFQHQKQSWMKKPR